MSVIFINGLLLVSNQAAEAPMGMDWSTAMDQEFQQQQQFGKESSVALW